MNNIRWGIIGCGNVTERKSGPAFYTLKNSTLIAVMRRNIEKAKDFAQRHNVPRYYTNAEELIGDPDVDAVYVSTPPDTHAHYSIMAMQAGKPVYVEKPMALNYMECKEMMEVSKQTGMPLFVAYYRRAQRYFDKVKNIIDSGVLGDIRFVEIRLFKPVKDVDKKQPLPWRLRPEISGGGYFVDVASHQIDLLQWLFGNLRLEYASAKNLGGFYDAEDYVTAVFASDEGVHISGKWCFCNPDNHSTDSFMITGSNGTLSFSVFSYTPIILDIGSKKSFKYKNPTIAQKDMIGEVNKMIRGQKSACIFDLSSAANTSRFIEKILHDFYRKKMV